MRDAAQIRKTVADSNKRPDDSVDEPSKKTSPSAEEKTSDLAAAKPVKRKHTQAPVKKAKPTKKRGEVAENESVGPIRFAKQSVGELKKVVWPTGDQTRQYFIVVLVFVLFIMTVVAGLDALFGWGLLQVLGR